MTIENLAKSAQPFALALTGQFRQTTIRQGMVFAGPSGWGEFAPFPEYNDEIAGRWLAGALEAAFGRWPDPVRTYVPVNAIISALGPQETVSAVNSAVSKFAMTTIKIKVAQPGQTFQDDLIRVRAARQTLDELTADGKIRIDANGGWTVLEAIENINRLAEFDLEYVEQPVDSLAQCTSVRESVSVRIAIDEGLRLAENLVHINVEEIRQAGDILIVKSIPLGGVAQSLEIIEQINLPVVISGSLDSSIGLESGLALAACVPDLFGACGFGTGMLLAQDLLEQSVLPVGGMLDVQRRTPDAELLTQATQRVTSDEQHQWKQRFIRAWYAGAVNLVTDDVRMAVEQW